MKTHNCRSSLKLSLFKYQLFAHSFAHQVLHKSPAISSSSGQRGEQFRCCDVSVLRRVFFRMLRVWRPSGQELAAVSAEAFQDAADLKWYLCKQYGFPVFMQQLVHDTGPLADGAKLDASMDLQLVLLTLSGPDQTGNAASIARVYLARAAQVNHIDMVRCLLEAGADKDRPDHEGFTPLMLASAHGHLWIARMLLEAGAAKDCCNHAGLTALMLASKHGHAEISRVLQEVGADKNRRDNAGMTALMFAAASGHFEVASLLLEFGAEKDCWCLAGKTALILASRHGHAEIARLLLESGAHTDCWDQNGMTALMLACRFGHLQVVRLLLEFGAEKMCWDQSGLTAAMHARQNHHLEVARILMEA